MNRILLDTNVRSELTRDEPEARVISFLNRLQKLSVTSIARHELELVCDCHHPAAVARNCNP